jgi:hypothetical protein
MPALTVLSLTVLLAGCGGGDGGPPRARVKGQVTLEEKPIEDGIIEFIPIDGTAGDSAQGQITNGQYDVPAERGPIIKGRYRVTISALRPVGKPLPNPFEGIAPAPPNLTEMENYVPVKYNVQSDLTATISEDPTKNQFDFALEKGPLARRRR